MPTKTTLGRAMLVLVRLGWARLDYYIELDLTSLGRLNLERSYVSWCFIQHLGVIYIETDYHV